MIQSCNRIILDVQLLMFLLLSLPSFFLSLFLNLISNPISLHLFLPCFLLFGVQELLRNAADIFLRAEKKTPELFHELAGVLLHESRQLDLNLFPIHFLSIEESINEIDKNLVFKSEQFRRPVRDPRLDYIHLYLPHIHQMIELRSELL